MRRKRPSKQVGSRDLRLRSVGDSLWCAGGVMREIRRGPAWIWRLVQAGSRRIPSRLVVSLPGRSYRVAIRPPFFSQARVGIGLKEKSSHFLGISPSHGCSSRKLSTEVCSTDKANSCLVSRARASPISTPKNRSGEVHGQKRV